MRQISYTKAAIKSLRRMPASTATLIRTKFKAYAQHSSAQANNVKSLKGREGMRLRIEGWRVILDDQDSVLAFPEIGPHGGSL